jgi:hypothetical protein
VTAASEVFARTVLAFEPYAAEIVYVGGWVHALYLTGSGAGRRPIMTDDVDVSLPTVLAAAGRPTLRELAQDAGFAPRWLADPGGPPQSLVYEVPDARSGIQVVDLDLLTDAPAPRTGVPIDGQPDLLAQGYPGQLLLQENVQWIDVGVAVHPMLDPPRRIRVPTLGAYVLQKGVASATRQVGSKAAKDLVYVYEIVRDAELGARAVDGIRVLSKRYPSEYARWRRQLGNAAGQERLCHSMAEQIVVAAGTIGAESIVQARIAAQFERLLSETPGH